MPVTGFTPPDPVTAWSGLTVTGGILDMEALMAAVPAFVVEPIADQYAAYDALSALDVGNIALIDAVTVTETG